MQAYTDFVDMYKARCSENKMDRHYSLGGRRKKKDNAGLRRWIGLSQVSNLYGSETQIWLEVSANEVST